MVMLCVCEGHEWRLFNSAQKRVRQDMVCLYGNNRNLVPQNMAASRADTSLWFFFHFQVEEALAIVLALLFPALMHMTCVT